MSQTKAIALTGASSGVGLRGMRERLAQVGGDLTLQSDGKGTLVTAILPLDEPTRNTMPEPMTDTESVVHRTIS
jgi:signal transduction histidine kinase